MKANLIEIRNQPKEWYDKDNEKYREIIEESDISLEFNLEDYDETFTLILNKNTFEKIKDKEILIKISGGKNE